MAGTVSVDRAQWLGHRWRGHGLDGSAGTGAGDRVGDALDDTLLLGFQGSRQAGPEQAVSVRTARIGRMAVRNAIGPEGPLVSMWSVRGAPHTHRVTRLDVVRDALAPRDSDDGGPSFVNAVAEVAEALTAVVRIPTSKGEASREVAEAVSGSLVHWCERCGARHVDDGLFRAAGRQAQIVLGPEQQRATMLHPRPDHEQDAVDEPRAAFLQAYFRVNGPTTRTAYRDWVGAGTDSVREVWQGLGSMQRVIVEGRRLELPEELVEDLRAAPAPQGVVLVPPHDPYLRQVDRTLLVPDSRRRQQVWKALSGPGAVLVEGEVTGTWRYRLSDGEISVSPFDAVPAPVRRAVERAAGVIAESVGAREPAVIWS